MSAPRAGRPDGLRRTRSPGRDDETTAQSTPDAAGHGLFLVAVARGAMAVHPLPAAGTVVLGRGSRAAITLDDASVSREHAALHVAAGVLALEDLDSRNGTFVRGATADEDDWRRLAPRVRTPLAIGSGARVGTVSVVVWSDPGASARLPPPTAAPAGEMLPGTVLVDPVMQRLYGLLARVAPSDLSVLLVGETGVGKEVLAEQLHRWSHRKSGPFLQINCAAVTETLFESELFGHEKGSFTGAVREKPGLLEATHGGTVMLDEVGELPLAMQAKLLRVLEEKRVLRVGGLAPRPIDVRIVAATHRDLAAAVEQGSFRRDLYFRLNGITLQIPPLRQRPGELFGLARAFAARAAERAGRSAAAFGPGALAWMRAQPWPGNVRELRNAVERAVLLAGAAPIEREHLAPDFVEERASVAPPEGGEPGGLRAAVREAERARVVEALAAAGGHQGAAAKLLGISRRTLIDRLDAYAIPRPRKPAPPR